MAAARLVPLIPLLALYACDGKPVAHPDPLDDTADSDSDTDTDTTGDTGGGTDSLPLGDNLVARGTSAVEFLEPTATAWLGDDRVLLCSGTNGLGLYDVSDLDAPRRNGGVSLPRPAGLRCQHLARSSGAAVVATHHGDETGDGWIALVDASEPGAPVALDAWSQPGVEPEGVAFDGEVALVAAHEAGLLRFDVSGGALDAPTTLAADIGNAYSVAVDPSGRIAVGTVDGDVVLLDADGNTLLTVAASGPVRDLEWLADGTLLAVCGSAGVDRVDLDAGVVVAHADVYGSALDAVVLSDGSVIVADWNDLRVFDGASLELLATEAPGTSTTPVALLGIDRHDDDVFVAEWQGLRTFSWDPTVSAPDIRADVASIDLGTLAAGEPAAWSLVLRNEGPKPLTISSISASDASVAVGRTSLEIAAGGADFVEVSWSSTGRTLNAALTIVSDDPDESEVVIPVDANRPTTGVGDLVPEFSYVAFNGTDTWNSRDLGGPALLTYFATF